MNSVEDRKESVAEHTWSTLMLADYFLNKTTKKLDELKIYNLIMYHDLIEIETGDIAVSPPNKISKKEKIALENNAIKILKHKIPKCIGEKFIVLFKEFEDCKTPESKFANAVDKLDAIIHEIDYKKDWSGWTEKFLREKKENFFIEFPEINKKFIEVLKYLKKEGYFDK